MAIKTKEKEKDPLWVATESHHRARTNGDPVFIAEGSKWRESSGLPQPGSNLWVPADSSDAEVADAKWQRLVEIELATETRNRRETPPTPTPVRVRATRTFEHRGFTIHQDDEFDSDHEAVAAAPEAFERVEV